MLRTSADRRRRDGAAGGDDLAVLQLEADLLGAAGADLVGERDRVLAALGDPQARARGRVVVADEPRAREEERAHCARVGGPDQHLQLGTGTPVGQPHGLVALGAELRDRRVARLLLRLRQGRLWLRRSPPFRGGGIWGGGPGVLL